MKRLGLATLAALFLVACQDGSPPTTPDGSHPNLAVKDGAHMVGTGAGNRCEPGDPCEHVFFLPPLVPTPEEFNGEFNPYLRPTVVVTELPQLSSGSPDDSPTTCVVGDTAALFTGADISVGGDNYNVNFQTGQYALESGRGYRICVQVGLTDLGYRDIQPDDSGADIPRNPDQLPIYQFNNGSNIPIKVRIETGIFCQNDADCGEATLGADGGTFSTNSGYAGLYVPEGGLDDYTNLVVEGVACNYATVYVDGDSVDAVIRHLPIDLPQFPGCYEVYSPDGPVQFAENPGATVGVCYDEAAVSAALGDEQAELLQLHHKRSSDGIVEALTAEQAPFVNCTDFTTSAAEQDAPGWLGTFARAAQQFLLPLIDPPALEATHKGFGGGGMEEGSPVVWALPAQFERVDGTEDGYGIEGEARVPDPVVKVTDQEGNPVKNASVYFAEDPSGNGDVSYAGAATISVPGLPGTRVLTNAGGLASVDWILGENPNLLNAEGAGIGIADGEEGSYDPTTRVPPRTSARGPFADHYNDDVGVVFLGKGILEFTATACEPAGSGLSADGVIGTGEYPNSRGFLASISGTSGAPATLYWGHDCESLYIGVQVTSGKDVKINRLRVDFDNDDDQDGTAEEFDDVAIMDVVGLESDGTGILSLSDQFLTARCVSRKQSDCGEDDTSDGGSFELEGAFKQTTVGGQIVWVYELKKPLNSTDPHDFAVGFGTEPLQRSVGAFITLQLGSGAQGNTQVPGFRDYQSLVVIPE